ncbi:AraC family transcriptional regulator [Allomuricauda sp. CP2A]|jgi:AraC-like DNA-binding protein/mannose-6-phosphate isomerase-like protein (cupin superfamily)|uniref:AraC family transcriptional regulator n=1 Tax=Allomuricauda sp. CP2A TaxID=1848189 RepID=UPI00082F10C8|nr:AraC family transcriptional regulator [Muricauda sp. CP2A]
MKEELNIKKDHHGFVFLYDSKNHRTVMNGPHHHKELELNIVIRGSAEYLLSDQRYRLARGNLVWLFPGQEHQLIKTDSKFKMYVIVFKEEILKKTILLDEKYKALSEKNPIGSFCRRISLPSMEKLEKVCASLCSLNDKKVLSPAYYYSGRAFGFKNNSEYLHSDPILLNAGLLYLMTVCWHLYLTEGNDENKEMLNPSIEKALNLLQRFPEKDFGLSELSYECGVSVSRLSRLFNEQIGCSLVDYKNKLKMEKFVDCMSKNPSYSISEACYQVGFGSYSQFYKIFKQNFGISPKAYFSEN